MVRPFRGLAEWLGRPLPTPPERWRLGPFRRDAFASTLRSSRLTARLGLALGIAFGICFVTGLLSHFIQHPPSWFAWPARPVWLYRVTQGLHVATGLASVALLSAKLWSVYPKLFAWPPLRDLRHALERLSVLTLIGAALFQLVTGVLDLAAWYAAMPFAFIASHYWVAWLLTGALLLHVAVKLPIIRAPGELDPGRRAFLGAVLGTAAVVTLATLGQTVRPLRGLSVLAPRRPDLGPQGLTVNMSAAAAEVEAAIADPAYRLVLSGPSGTRELTLAELEALPQTTVDLPIACVEGWSADARWTGVRIRELAALVGGAGRPVIVESLQKGGAYRTSVLDRDHAADPLSLLALRLHGEPLHADHGYPARLIAPNRPGVMQTKWVGAVRIEP